MTAHDCKITHLWRVKVGLGEATLTTKQYREELLTHGGRVIAAGRVVNITGKRIGPGVYRVKLEVTR